MTLKKCMSLILLLVAAPAIMAQGTSESKQSVQKDTIMPKDWSASLSATYSSDLLEDTSVDKYTSLITSLKVGYKLPYGSLSLKGQVNQGIQGSEDTVINDTIAAYSRPSATLADGVTSFGSLAFKIPTNEDTRDVSALYTSINVVEGFALNEAFMGIEKFSLSTFAVLSKNFNEFTTNENGSELTSWSLMGALNLSYSILENLDFTLGGSFANSYTYLGTRKQIYSIGQSLGYTINKKASLEFGHELGATPISANGQSIEIDFFDTRASSWYLNLTYNL